jgi:hypothetical protein
MKSAELSKRKIADRNTFDHDVINCGTTHGQCWDEANRRQRERIEIWQKVMNAENQRHQYELIAIKDGVGCERPRDVSRAAA